MQIHVHIYIYILNILYIYLYIYIWGLFKIMVPQKGPYAALSRTLRALSRCSKINTWNYDHIFVCIFRTKDVKRNWIQNILKTNLNT